MPDSQVVVYRDTFLSLAHLSGKQMVNKHNRTWTFTRTCIFTTDRGLRYSPVINATRSGNNASFRGCSGTSKQDPVRFPTDCCRNAAGEKDAARRPRQPQRPGQRGKTDQFAVLSTSSTTVVTLSSARLTAALAAATSGFVWLSAYKAPCTCSST
jgi:hypothetical protein